MGRQIIKQPNGLYCIFSSVVDNITHYNMNKDEIITEWSNEAKADIEQRVENIIRKLENGENPYFHNKMSYKEMLEDIKNVHGWRESKKINSLITKADEPKE